MSEMIRLDAVKEGAQARVKTDKKAIKEYTFAMREGAQFPPIVVFRRGDSYWLADGFHRVEAARCAEREEIEADIREGSRRDALLFACGANVEHGLRRTNADKRRAVTLLVQDDEWKKKSSKLIADHCGVDDRFVEKLRKKLSADDPTIDPSEREVVRGGTSYKLRKRKAPEKEIIEAEPEPSGAERAAPELPQGKFDSADHDGFVALTAAWERANVEDRRRFTAWLREHEPAMLTAAPASATVDAPPPADRTPELLPAESEDAINARDEYAQVEPTTPQTAPAMAAENLWPSIEQIRGMGADDLRRLAYAHGLDCNVIEKLNNTDLKT